MKQLIAFILLSGLLCWFMFSPLYKHVLIMRQAVLQKEVDLLLEVGTNASHGYIDATMIEESRVRLAERGFEPEHLEYIIQATDGSSATDPNQPVIRGEGIQLTIHYPYQQLLQIDQLIGLSPPSSHAKISAGGMKMSEYLP